MLVCEFLELLDLIGSTLFIRIRLDLFRLLEIVWNLNWSVPFNLNSKANYRMRAPNLKPRPTQL